jgi:hypothetical protein
MWDLASACKSPEPPSINTTTAPSERSGGGEKVAATGLSVPGSLPPDVLNSLVLTVVEGAEREKAHRNLSLSLHPGTRHPLMSDVALTLASK